MVHTPSKAEMERPHLESIEPKKRKVKKHAKNDGTPELRHDFEERRTKKLQKQAKKVAEHFAALGLDENGDPLDNFSLLKYPVREWKFTIPGCHEPIALNPVVVLVAVLCLWGMVLWNVASPTTALTTLLDLRTNVTTAFTAFFQGSKALLFIFLMFVWYKYGHIHLGKQGDRPEFSTMSYFSMSFVAGTGSSALYYCVQEPLYHQFGHFYAQAGYRSQDEIDMYAINMTVSNWGICSWTHYTLVAVCMALAVHRFNLPLTFRSCLYPILGAYTWGWMGDFIDGMAVVVSVAGSCTLLGSTVMLLVAGLVELGWINETSSSIEITTIQKIATWVLVFVSTAIAVAGLRRGIHVMCLLAMGIGALLLGLLMLLEDTKFLLNLQVQSLGLFLQTGLAQLNFWTDAFGQLQPGSGRATDGKAADQSWMTSWTILYVAWVVTCSIGVGVFVASISRGRRVGEVIVHGLVAPVAYCLVWFCTWGGTALRQARQATELAALGEMYYNNSRHFSTDGSELCFDVPQTTVDAGGETFFTNHLPGVSPVCQFDPVNPNSAVFNVLRSFKVSPNGKGLGVALTLLFIVGVACFFVGNTDASTLVVDSLASNGRKNYHWTRRLFWATTTGALTTVLLSSGGSNSLYAIQSASVVCGLPVAVLLCYFIQSVTLFCEAAVRQGDAVADYPFPTQPEFGMPVYGGAFNTMEYIVSLGRVNAARIEAGMDRATYSQAIEFGKGLLVPFVSLHQTLQASYPQNPKSNTIIVVVYSGCYFGWIILYVASISLPGLRGMALTLFFITGIILGTLRRGFRHRHNLRSNVVADYVASLLVWPQVLTQMRLYEPKESAKNENDEEPCGDDEEEDAA